MVKTPYWKYSLHPHPQPSNQTHKPPVICSLQHQNAVSYFDHNDISPNWDILYNQSQMNNTPSKGNLPLWVLEYPNTEPSTSIDNK